MVTYVNELEWMHVWGYAFMHVRVSTLRRASSGIKCYQRNQSCVFPPHCGNMPFLMIDDYLNHVFVIFWCFLFFISIMLDMQQYITSGYSLMLTQVLVRVCMFLFSFFDDALHTWKVTWSKGDSFSVLWYAVGLVYVCEFMCGCEGEKIEQKELFPFFSIPVWLW